MEGRGEEFNRKPFLIGVAGGTAAGKSTVCKKIVDELGLKGSDEEGQRVYVLSLESFYRTLSEDEITLAEKGQFDFDHPRAFDYDMLRETMLEIISKRAVEIFEYDHTLHKRDFTKSRKIISADVVFIEGILVFYQEDIRSLFNMKLFVDTDADTRLARRVERDIEVLGRPLENILHQYITYVKPAFEEFCLPTKKYADVIIPRGADNTVAVDLIVQHIKDLLKGRGMKVKQSSRVHTVDPLQIYLSTDPTGSDPVLHSPSTGSSIKRYLSEDQYSEYH